MTGAGTQTCDRAVSTTVTYVLTVAITTVLMSGLIMAAGGVLDDRTESATRNELAVVGERLANELVTADRLVVAGTESTVRLRTTHPTRVVGSSYTVLIRTGSDSPCDGPQCLVLSAGDVTVTVPFTTDTPAARSSVTGGAIIVRYDRSAGTLEVTDP